MRGRVLSERDGLEVGSTVPGQVGALWEVLSKQAVRVLVGAALPWAVRVAEVDLDAGVDAQLGVLGHLRSLVPGQRPPQLLGQGGDGIGDGIAHSLGAVARQRRTVLGPRLAAVAIHGRQMQQQREPGGALDERPDRRAVEADDEVAFPVAGHGTVRGLGGPLADQDLRGHERLPAATGPCAGDAQRPPGAQARHELALEGTPTLDIQRLIDRLVRDPHGLIIGEVDTEPVRDLLWAPRLRPPPVGAPSGAAADVPHRRAGDEPAVGPGDRSGEAVLHVLAQGTVAGELGDLGPAGAPLGVPLGGRRPIDDMPAAGRRIAPQLTRDRRGRATHTAGDLAHPVLLDTQDGDLLAFGERQVTPRERGERDRWHPASVPEPARPDGR